MTSLGLSVLDLSPVPAGKTPRDALENSIDLARHAEAIGLTRVWLAEHHNAASLVSSAPEILIAQIAAATKTLRVGAGGIMLPNHSPLKVAELFRVLSALFPERIDLGLGRAAGTDPRTAFALRRAAPHASADDFPEQMTDLMGYLDDTGEPRGPFARTVRAVPTGVPTPPVWILGSSDYGGAFAAKAGFGFAFAHHINPHDSVVTLKKYRAEFKPSKYWPKPRSILTLAAACGSTERDIHEIQLTSGLAALRFATGLRDLPYPTVDEAKSHVWSEEDLALVRGVGARGFIGTPKEVSGSIRSLAETCDVDEVMVLTHTHSHELRKQSYTLLKEALG
ncbi:MAG: LLM class flavin-dependent oxidoreductase [Polyangiaceae bacterium]